MRYALAIFCTMAANTSMSRRRACTMCWSMPAVDARLQAGVLRAAGAVPV